MTDTLTNNRRKEYASLATAKGRKHLGMFMAQGTKCVLDTIGHFGLEALLATADWISEHEQLCSVYAPMTVRRSDLQKITTMPSVPDVVAIYRIPQTGTPRLEGRLSLALDCVQDPGNLGTIMRVADWMGVETILASHDTVDLWNPKVVQATMGAISRVKMYYCDLPAMLAEVKPVYGTFLDGEDIYRSDLATTGVIVMGNEGNGIGPEVARLVTHRLTIPSYPRGAATSESLNVAIATAITLAEFRRRTNA